MIIHSQTSTVQPLKFANGYIISCHTILEFVITYPLLKLKGIPRWFIPCWHITNHTIPGTALCCRSIMQSVGGLWCIYLKYISQVKPRIWCIDYWLLSGWMSRETIKNVFMMTSSNGNIFRVTGHWCGEFTILRTKASDAELWCFLWSASE